MAKTEVLMISKGLKYLFLIHGIFSLIFGLLLCFIPIGYAGCFKDIGPVDPCPMRLLGAFILALGVKDWFCFVSKRWDDVRISVLMEIALTVFSTIVCLYVLLFVWRPSEIWWCFVVFPAFAVAWIYFYFKQRR